MLLLFIVIKLLPRNAQGISSQRASVVWEKILNRFLVVKYQALTCKALLFTLRVCNYMTIISINAITGDQSAGILFESIMMVSSKIGRHMQTRDSFVNEVQTRCGQRRKEKREGERGWGAGTEHLPTSVLCISGNASNHNWLSWIISFKGKVIENQGEIRGL